MNQTKLLINILVGLIILGAIVGGYFYFKSSGESDIGLSTTVIDPLDTTLSAETSEFLVLLESLQAVELSGNIFRHPVFANLLVNFTTEIPARPQGRNNPFAPLGVANKTNTSVPDEETLTPNSNPATAPNTNQTTTPANQDDIDFLKLFDSLN